MAKKVFIGLAWPYAIGARHVGHASSSAVPGDIFARYCRMRGYDVLMVSGTDDFGVSIENIARLRGTDPASLVESSNIEIARDLQALGVSYDLFTRTSTLTHQQFVNDCFDRLQDAGVASWSEVVEPYDSTSGDPVPDRRIRGTCPQCGFSDACGDQCDGCDALLSPGELIEPHSWLDKRPPVWRRNLQAHLHMSELLPVVRKWLRSQRHWSALTSDRATRDSRRNSDFQVTRDVRWGVDVRSQNGPARTFYGWFEAMLGYISASQEWADKHGTPGLWRQWWCSRNARRVLFMGIDNVGYHAVAGAATLVGLQKSGMPVELPTDIVGAPLLTLDGQKMSASRGHSLLLRDALQRYGADALRIGLAMEPSDVERRDFSVPRMIERVGTMAADLDDLLRAARTQPGEPVETVDAVELVNGSTATYADVLRSLDSSFRTVGAHIEHFRFAEAATKVASVIADCATRARSIDDPAQASAFARRALPGVAVLLAPFAPSAARSIWKSCNFAGDLGPMPDLQSAPYVARESHAVLVTPAYDGPAWGPPGLVALHVRECDPPFAQIDRPSAVGRARDGHQGRADSFERTI